MAELPKLYTVKEVAKAAKQSPQAIYNHINKGALPARNVGGNVRIAEPDALRYLGESSDFRDSSE